MSSPHIPASTARVVEFRCVFTRNPRRKQKTWVDGRLQLHTFNQRVMVHDERGNLVGDAYWRSQRELEDGDELELDRGGILVQVLDSTGSRDQDISVLWESKLQRAHAVGTTSLYCQATGTDKASLDGSPTPRPHQRPHTQTPGSHLGATGLPVTRRVPRSVQYPTSSPHSPPSTSSRIASLGDDDDDGVVDNRPYKKKKPQEKSCHARALFGAALSLNNVIPPSTPQPNTTQPQAQTQTQTRRSIQPPIRSSPSDLSEPRVAARSTKDDATTLSKPSTKGSLDGVTTSPRPNEESSLAEQPRSPENRRHLSNATRPGRPGASRKISSYEGSAVPEPSRPAYQRTRTEPHTTSAGDPQSGTVELPTEQVAPVGRDAHGEVTVKGVGLQLGGDQPPPLPAQDPTQHEPSDSTPGPPVVQPYPRSLHMRSKRKRGLMLLNG